MYNLEHFSNVYKIRKLKKKVMFRVSIVGFGPRGLCILERLISKKLGGKINKELRISINESKILAFSQSNIILPLIVKEMEYVYSYTYIAREQSFLFRNAYILAENSKNVVDSYT